MLGVLDYSSWINRIRDVLIEYALKLNMNRAEKRVRRVHLRRFRQEYERSIVRPARVRSHKNNYLLLDAGWDVIWDTLIDDIRDAIKTDNHNRLSILLKANIERIDLPVTIDAGIIDQLRSRDIIVNLLMDSHPNNIAERLNLSVNYRDANLTIEGCDPISRECARLVKTEYTADSSCHKVIYSYQHMIDEFFSSSEMAKHDLFAFYVTNNYTGRLIVILELGYSTDWSSLPIGGFYTFITMIKSIINEDEKFKLFKSYVEYCDDDQIYNHPYLNEFWYRLHEEGVDIPRYPDRPYDDVSYRLRYYLRTYRADMVNEIIDYEDLIHRAADYSVPMSINYLEILGGRIPEELRAHLAKKIINNNVEMYLTNPVLSEYWSTIPTDNDELLMYLEYRELPLPPIKMYRLCLARLRSCDNINEEVRSLLDDYTYNRSDKYDIELLILQLINNRLINIRNYRGYPLADMIIPHSSIYTMKNSRTRLN